MRAAFTSSVVPQACSTVEEVFNVLSVAERSTKTSTKSVALTTSWSTAREALAAVLQEPADLSANMEGRFPSTSTTLGVHAQRMRWHCNVISAAAMKIHVPRDVFGELGGFQDDFARRVVQGIDRQQRRKRHGKGTGVGDVQVDSERIEKVMLHFEEWIENAFPAHVYPTISVADLESLLASHNAYAEGVEFGEPLSLRIRPHHGVLLPALQERALPQAMTKWVKDNAQTAIIPNSGVNRVSVLNIGCKSGSLTALLMLAGAQNIIATDDNEEALKTTEQVVQALWKSKRVSHIDRDIQVLKAELFPSSIPWQQSKKNRNDDLAERKFNMATYEAVTPPLFMSPTGLAAFSNSWNKTAKSLARFCDEISRPSTAAAKMLSDVSYVGITHSNFHDLLSSTPEDLRSGFSPNNAVRELIATSERSTSPFRPRIRLVENSLASLERLGDRILKNEALLDCVQDEGQRYQLVGELSRFYSHLRHELVILERRKPLLVAGASTAAASGNKGSVATALSTKATTAPSSMNVPWKETFEYNNYLPKKGPTNPHHVSYAMDNFSYLEDDEDALDIDSDGMTDEDKFKHRVLRAESRQMAGNSIANFTNPTTGRKYNAEAAQKFSSLFNDELSVAKNAKNAAAKQRKIRKMANKARSTQNWYLDKKAMKSEETKMNIGLELERFNWKLPK